MPDILADISAFLTPVLSALIIWYIQHCHAENDKKRDEALHEERRIQEERNKEAELRSLERAEARKKESLLTMQMIKAIGKLSYANAVALKEGKVNGVMEDAMMYYKDTSGDMTLFLQEQAIDNYSK